MAHNFVDPTQVVGVGLELVVQDLVLAATMSRDFEDEFGGGKGASVNVRVPAVLAARERALHETGAITVDEIVESTVPVALQTHAYSAVDVDDAHLTLEIEDFARQVLSPQTLAVVESIENRAVQTMQALPETTSIAWDAANPAKAFTAARKTLRDLGIPAAGMYAAVGTQVYADLLDSKALEDASQSGSTSALREAVVGRLRGFNVLESNRLGETEIVFYNRAAFALAVRAPKVPDGASFGKSQASNGFALRWVKDYDAARMSDRSVLSTFVGCQSMTVATTARDVDGKAIRQVPAIRIDTATAAT